MSLSEIREIEQAGFSIATQFCSLPPTSLPVLFHLDFIQKTVALAEIRARADLRDYVGNSPDDKLLPDFIKRQALPRFLEAIGQRFADFVIPEKSIMRDDLSEADWKQFTSIHNPEVVKAFQGYIREAMVLVSEGTSVAEVSVQANMQNLRNMTSGAYAKVSAASHAP